MFHALPDFSLYPVAFHHQPDHNPPKFTLPGAEMPAVRNLMEGDNPPFLLQPGFKAWIFFSFHLSFLPGFPQ